MTLSNTLQRVIKVITKPPITRSKAEIDLLLPWLRKKSDILSNLETDILIILMRYCTYQKTSRDDVIIQQGDKGDCFYIMLSGKTSVYIDTATSDEEHLPISQPGPNPDHTKHHLHMLTEEQESRNNKRVQSTNDNSAKWAIDRTLFGRFIIAFEAGKSFGEIALISQDAVRNASIIADDDTDLLVIDRTLFNGTLKSKQEAEYQQRKSFIRKCVLFRNWSSKFRRLCEMSLRKVSLPFDSVLVKQGEPVIGLQFIIKGQGKVIVDPNQHKMQYPKMKDVETDIIAEELGQKYQKRETKSKDTSLREHIRVRRREGYAAAERRLSTKSVTMCYVDESEIIGDTEVVLGLDTYTQSIICTANTEVLILDYKNIDRLIHKKNPHTLEQLRQIVEDKLRSRTCMRVGSQIPLFTHLLHKMEDAKPRRLVTAKLRDEEDKPRTIADTVSDRDVMVSQLSKMFIQDKSPFIEPSVPGSLYYLTKSKERAEKRAATKIRDRKLQAGRTGEVRLQRARKAARRQPRSRRELERLTLGSESQDMKQLQESDHTVNKYYTAHMSGVRPKSAIELAGRSDGTFLTESTREFSETSGDQTHLGYRDITSNSMQNIVAGMNDRQQTINTNRSKVICSMLDKKTTPAKTIPSSLRPESAPIQVGQGGRFSDEEEEEEEEGESFDWETSNHALRELEDKLRSFYDKHEPNNKKSTANVMELKRFNVNGPEDVPIPGGTVYVRQKTCQYPGGASSNTEYHQHVRRFIIPKDAYRVAVRSLSAIDTQMADRVSSRSAYGTRSVTSSSRVQPGVPGRPTTSQTSVTSQNHSSMTSHGRSNTSQTRIQSAPVGRKHSWT